MGSKIVAVAPGNTPQFGTDPLSVNPGAVAHLAYFDNGTARMDIQIQGVGGLGGYTAPAVAVIEHYDPFANAIVRDFALVGGTTGATTVSIAIGGPAGQTGSGEVKVAIYNLAGGNLFVLGNKFLNTMGLGDKLGNLDANASFAVTDVGGAPIFPADQALISSLARTMTQQIVQRFPDPSPCFAAGTPILMADGSEKPIEKIRVGDLVLGFQPNEALGRGPLCPGKVTRLFYNATDTWLQLSLSNSDERPSFLTTTPEHRFLSVDGSFRRIDEIIQNERQIVLRDGSVAEISARRISYSSETASLYTETNITEFETHGSAALKAHRKTNWRTYNFEVEKLHTYVAGGIRVHNDCSLALAISPEQFSNEFGRPFDGSQADVDQLLGAIIQGRIAATGEYVSNDNVLGPFSADGSEKIVINRDSASWFTSMVLNGEIKQITQSNSDGSGKVTLLDPNNTHPYDKLEISEGPDGKVTAAQVTLDPNVLAAGMAIGQIFGSALGGALGGNSLVGNIVGSTIGGLIGQKFVQVLATTMTADLSTISLNDVFAGQGISVANAGIGAVSSFLTAELGHALHIEGFDGQLFNTAVNGFTTSLLIQVTDEMVRGGLDFAGAIAAIDWTQALSGAIDVAEINLGNLLGSYLGHELVPAQTREGAIGGQVFGAIGGFILGPVGSFIGTIIGTLIFNHFGTQPSPGAVDLLDQAGYFYGHSQYQSSDGGGYGVSNTMAQAADDIVNAYLHAVNGAALDHSKQVTLGYIKNPDLLYVTGVPGNANRNRREMARRRVRGSGWRHARGRAPWLVIVKGSRNRRLY
jgi:hypothetical protein